MTTLTVDNKRERETWKVGMVCDELPVYSYTLPRLSTDTRTSPPPSLSLSLSLSCSFRYGQDKEGVQERHRHRYEVNPDIVDKVQAAGLHFTGTCDRGQRMEIAELPRTVHPFYFAAQYHPEFQSHPHKPSPPFLGFILAASNQLETSLPPQEGGGEGKQ